MVAVVERSETVVEITTTTLLKFTNANRMPSHGGFGQWPVPGEWRSVTPPVVACENGLHLCTPRQAMEYGWFAAEAWLVEWDGERIDHDDKSIVQRARLVQQVPTWNDQVLRLWACDCAERVLHIIERDSPDEHRAHEAIRIARRFAFGLATRDELAAARDAAWAAARDAARDAAWAAARDAAWAAARDAARDAAWAAARAAAWDAARDAAWAAAWEWQTERMLAYLNGSVDLDAMRDALVQASAS